MRQETVLWWVVVLLVIVGSLSSPVGAQGTLRIGYTSTPDFGDLPSLIASERLRERGYQVEAVFFAQPELLGQGLLQGNVDIGSGSIATAFQAIRQGRDIKVIANMLNNEWSVMAIKEIRSCHDLPGRRFAIHSEGAISTAMIRNWLAEEGCPEPNFLVIPGSDVRAQALLAGQIDVTPVELSDALNIDRQRPGQFHRIADFSRDLPQLLANGYYTSDRALRTNRGALKAFLTEVIRVHREIADDPEVAVTAAMRHLPDMEEDVVRDTARAWVDLGLWPVNGDLTEEAIAFSIDFYTNAGAIRPGLSPADAADLSLLREVLAEIGVR